MVQSTLPEAGVSQWQARPVADWEASLYEMMDRLFKLRPAVERYNELSNILTGLMLIAGLNKVEVPGLGRAELKEGELIVTLEGVAHLRPFI
jgi:hypothetical protein